MKKINKFQQIVDAYILEKRSMGHKYELAAKRFRCLVKLQEQFDSGEEVLSKKTVFESIKKQPWESDNNWSHRISRVRCLAKYMVRMGFEAYVVPERFAPNRVYTYKPYIFSDVELGAFLKGVDTLFKTYTSKSASLVFPLLFRVLIGCGLRITEALCIEKKDLNLDNGTLLLLNTKNKKERIIPMADSLCESCRKYLLEIKEYRKFRESKYLFPNFKGEAYNSRTAYTKFRESLWSAGISHGGKGNGPRLHDLRHTFAVRVLKKWVQEGKNLSTAMPYLSVYMGHAGLKGTQHYLRLTADMFPNLVKTVEQKYGWVIPEVCNERN